MEKTVKMKVSSGHITNIYLVHNGEKKDVYLGLDKTWSETSENFLNNGLLRVYTSAGKQCAITPLCLLV